MILEVVCPISRERALSVPTHHHPHPFWGISRSGTDGQTEIRFEDLVRREKQTTNLVGAFMTRFS